MALCRSLILMLLFQITLFSNLKAADDCFPPSYDPPNGLAIDSCPIFIVLGFDDNRYVDGMEWVLNLLEERTNPPGISNPATFDGTPITASFYHISGALDEDPDGSLLATWKLAYERGHEVGNHTVTHNTGPSLTKAQWIEEMEGCRDRLSEAIGIPRDEIVGFRTPYLGFNGDTFKAIKELGMLYDCTMTQHQDIHKQQFVWPYTLDEGFPYGSLEKGNHIIPGQWQIPAYTFGAWTEPYLLWTPVLVNFDHSMLTQAYGAQYEEFLINAVNYRLLDETNRAPITVGLHSDNYCESNKKADSTYVLKLDQRREALTNFIDYALTIPEVRFVSAIQLIEWMRNPIPLGREPITPNSLNPKAIKKENAKISVKLISASSLFLDVPHSGNYNVSIYNISGKCIMDFSDLKCSKGINNITFNKKLLSKGSYIIKVTGHKVSTVNNILF